jgi:hypothetical protein
VRATQYHLQVALCYFLHRTLVRILLLPYRAGTPDGKDHRNTRGVAPMPASSRTQGSL